MTFVKGDGYALIGNPDFLDGFSTDHEYFCIRDDLFDRILATEQYSDMSEKQTGYSDVLTQINFI